MEDKELTILLKCFQQLSELDEEARFRVMFWLNDRFHYSPASPTATHLISGTDTENDKATEMKTSENGIEREKVDVYDTIGNLIEVLTPRTAADKVLITSYFLQEIEKEDNLSGRLINNELKQLDEGVKNITATISTLIEQDPPLMLQVKKKGTRPQSQKTYRVSKAGLQHIEEKIKSKTD